MKKIIKDQYGSEYEIENGKVERIYIPSENKYLGVYVWDKKYECYTRRYLSYSYLKKLEKNENVRMQYEEV